MEVDELHGRLIPTGAVGPSLGILSRVGFNHDLGDVFPENDGRLQLE